MKVFFLICTLMSVSLLFFSSCNNETPEALPTLKLSGFVQKGPFLNGTSVSVSELKQDLSQTGKVFTSQIKDNLGTFELSGIQLASSFVELRANGFYYNEVTGMVSNAQLTLNGLADVSNINTLNVNVLSTLEKARVEKLVSAGLSFAEAKKKAMEEILAVFSLSKTDIRRSELLDINKSGDDNGILLAVSSILQGYRSEAELSELLANLSADISPDGKLDSEALKTSLISHAKYLNSAKIRQNLVNRYNEIGAAIQIPEFEKYITQFIGKSTYKAMSLLTYPETVDGVLNILNENNTSFISYKTDFGRYYSFSALAPKGMTLKIKLEFITGGESGFGGYWAFRMESDTNWKNTIYDGQLNSQIFEVVEPGKQSNLKVLFMSGNETKIRISYFENNNEIATRTRIITVN